MKSKRFGAKMPFLLALAFLLVFAGEGAAVVAVWMNEIGRAHV